MLCPWVKGSMLTFTLKCAWAGLETSRPASQMAVGKDLSASSLTDTLLACGSGTSLRYAQRPGPGFFVNQGTASRPSGRPPASVRRGLRFCPPSPRPSLGPSVGPETHTPALSSSVHADCPQQVTWSRVRKASLSKQPSQCKKVLVFSCCFKTG